MNQEMLLTLAALRHVSTSANDLSSRFAPAAYKFGAPKHEMTQVVPHEQPEKTLHNVAKRFAHF